MSDQRLEHTRKHCENSLGIRLYKPIGPVGSVTNSPFIGWVYSMRSDLIVLSLASALGIGVTTAVRPTLAHGPVEIHSKLR